jgi:pSer/pThr/pTyr-binding forkhead associated (FHA) protein
MSFTRLIYWSGLLGAWSAFVAWLFCEVVFGRWLSSDTWGVPLVILMGTLVGAAIGGGLSQASGLVNFRWQEQLMRLALGLTGGFIAGLIGSIIGSFLFWLLSMLPFIGFVGRVLGWTFLGAVLGIVEGVYDRSLQKIRNGLIGSAAGGFVAGVLFNPFAWLIGSPMSGRAIGFVLLGGFVGILIGLVQVFLKEAWLTVQAGFRPGRQLILSRTEITMGTSEKSSLIFIAMGAKGVEPLHLRIVRAPDGSFVLHDNGSRTGTFLNGTQLRQPTMLRSGDTIQFGVNVVRFNERFKRADAVGDQALPQPMPPMAAPPPIPVLTPVSTGVVQGAPPRPAVAVAARPAVVAAPARPAVSPIQAAPARPAVPHAPASRPAIPAPAVTAPAAPAPRAAVPPSQVPTVVAGYAAPAPSAAVPPPRTVPTACPVCGSHDLAKTADSCRCRSCFTVIH